MATGNPDLRVHENRSLHDSKRRIIRYCVSFSDAVQHVRETFRNRPGLNILRSEFTFHQETRSLRNRVGNTVLGFHVTEESQSFFALLLELFHPQPIPALLGRRSPSFPSWRYLAFSHGLPKLLTSRGIWSRVGCLFTSAFARFLRRPETQSGGLGDDWLRRRNADSEGFQLIEGDDSYSDRA